MKILTAEEEAIRLVNQFSELVDSLDTAKKCALMCVNEILSNERNSHSCLDKTYDYWLEVKENI